MAKEIIVREIHHYKNGWHELPDLIWSWEGTREQSEEKSDAINRLFRIIKGKMAGEKLMLGWLARFEYSEEEKRRTKKRRKAAQKGLVTRYWNKMEKIRLEYSGTLFPKEYLNDPRYKKLEVKYTVKQHNLKLL